MNPAETAEPTVETRKSTEVESVFVSNYPPFSFWKPERVSDFEGVLQAPPQDDVPLGLYLHIPFCRKRCKFCYFRVYTDKNARQIASYLDALAREVELYSVLPAVRDRHLKFVYFGGGTPSYIAVKHLKQLVGRLQAALPWDAAEEVAFECEPGTLTRSKLEAVREIGVTRLSLGIENFNDDILQENGRAHLSHEIYRCLPWIREQQFDQLNVDLIAGMVGESWESWRESVRKTIDVGPDSVTIYQMELPYNTVYSQGILSGSLASPVADWETKRAWQDYAFDELAAAGYEVSSAYTMVRRNPETGEARARFVYRDSLWQGADMVSAGVASFGHLSGVHFQNVSSWGEYLGRLEEGKLPLARAFTTNATERLTREFILQLKLGIVDPGYFRNKFGVDPLDAFGEALGRLRDRQMLELRGDDRIELSRQGLLQVDSLLPEFYEEKYRHARYT